MKENFLYNKKKQLYWSIYLEKYISENDDILVQMWLVDSVH